MGSFIIANWKENLTVTEAQEWVEKISSKFKVQSSKLEVVVCPSFVILPMMAYEVSKLKGIKLGAQDVSKFAEGPYTGEVSAKQLADFVSYAIVGHSERRRYFGETNEDIGLKIEQCLTHNLTPIVCVSSIRELSSLPSELSSDRQLIIVYEPVEAISREGEYHPADPAHAQEMAQKIKNEVGADFNVLYGGSVNAKNVKSFINQPDISGVLVGQAGLDAEEFTKIVNCL